MTKCSNLIFYLYSHQVCHVIKFLTKSLYIHRRENVRTLLKRKGTETKKDLQ